MSAPQGIPKLEASPAIDGLVEGQAAAGKEGGIYGFNSTKEAERNSGRAVGLNQSGPAPLPSPPNETRLSPQGSPRAIPISSPTRMYRSSSPRLHSPASSLIFERNVQESTLAGELSPAIPAHIQTEDHIPPVLEASSLAITDDHLNPDEVEIVMATAHQPAAAAVTGEGGMTESLISSLALQDETSASIGAVPGAHVPSFTAQTPSPPSTVASPISSQPQPSLTQPHPPHLDESTSNYGSLDATDVRRLSFISFADVVQSEHVEQTGSLLSSPTTATAPRSPSPIRSSFVSTSPPRTGSPAVKPLDHLAAARMPGGSPRILGLTHSPPGTMASGNAGGELTIETMTEALRKTGSEDIGGSSRSPTQATATSGSAFGDDLTRPTK